MALKAAEGPEAGGNVVFVSFSKLFSRIFVFVFLIKEVIGVKLCFKYVLCIKSTSDKVSVVFMTYISI